LAAIRRASSLVSNLAAERRPGSFYVSESLPVTIAHDEAGFLFFDGPRRREALTI
jgi:hypothetical protein